VYVVSVLEDNPQHFIKFACDGPSLKVENLITLSFSVESPYYSREELSSQE